MHINNVIKSKGAIFTEFEKTTEDVGQNNMNVKMKF